MPNPALDLRHDGLADAGHSCDIRLPDALRNKIMDAQDRFFGQPRISGIETAWSYVRDKPCGNSVSDVINATYPFKIVRAIVCLITVLVVNLRKIFGIWYEGFCHKAMYRNPFSSVFAAFGQDNMQVRAIRLSAPTRFQFVQAIAALVPMPAFTAEHCTRSTDKIAGIIFYFLHKETLAQAGESAKQKGGQPW